MANPQQGLESQVGTLFTNLREEAKLDPGVQPGYNITYQGNMYTVGMVQFRNGEFCLAIDKHGLIKPKDVTSFLKPSDLITDADIGEEYQIKVKHADPIKYGDEILTLTARVLAQRSLGPNSLTYLRVIDSDDVCIISTASLIKHKLPQTETATHR